MSDEREKILKTQRNKLKEGLNLKQLIIIEIFVPAQ
jgi:hypothetical protein